MAKAILIYGSTTGNTKELSKGVIEGLKKGGIQATIKNVTEANVNELVDYDLIVLGCSTWGEGELQDDFVPFYDQMGNVTLTEKKAAVFGPGDKETYPDTFCTAVDMLEDKLRKCGAEIVAEGFKVDGEVELVVQNAQSWGFKVAKSL
jgi:flavodoxin I